MMTLMMEYVVVEVWLMVEKVEELWSLNSRV